MSTYFFMFPTTQIWYWTEWQVNPFCHLQMKLGHIYYMHDSTESTKDSFTLSASAYEIERRSLPVTISVTVIPVNDEPPKLTRNTGLEVTFCSFNIHTAVILSSHSGLNSENAWECWSRKMWLNILFPLCILTYESSSWPKRRIGGGNKTMSIYIKLLCQIF